MSPNIPYPNGGFWRLSILAFGIAMLVPGFAQNAAGKSMGWRLDGSGVYGDQKPPTMAKTGTQIRWKAVLPGTSNGSPVVVGNRVYVVSEPTVLLAMDAETGKILWQRDNNYMDALEGEARAEAEKELAAARALRVELDARKKELYGMKRRLRGASPKPGLAVAMKALEQRVNDMLKAYELTWRVRELPPIELIGYSSATPVVDDTGVYVGFGNGVLSSFDFDGTRRWSVGLGESPVDMRGYHKGHSSSPIIVGEYLVFGYQKLRAFNKSTGKLIWEGKPFLDFGTPIHLKVGAEDLVATAQGEIYRLKDGALLTEDLGDVWHCGPVVDRETIYYVGAGLGQTGEGAKAQHRKAACKARAIRLVMKGGKFSYERLWETPVELGDYYASPTLHRGILYTVSIGGALTALNAATGEVHYRKMLTPLGRVFSSPAVAGGLLYIFGPSGKVWAYGAGPGGELVAEGQVGPRLDYRVWSSPFFAENSIFVREAEHLYRFGANP